MVRLVTAQYAQVWNNKARSANYVLRHATIPNKKQKQVNQDHLQYSIEYYSIPKFLIWIMFLLHCIFQHQKALTFVPQEKLRSSQTRQKQ